MSKSAMDMTEKLLAKLSQQPQQPQPQQQPKAQTPAPDPAPAKMSKAAKTASVYMTADQHAALDRIAKELGTNKHNVMQIAVRHFIADYDSGQYIPEPRYKKVYY